MNRGKFEFIPLCFQLAEMNSSNVNIDSKTCLCLELVCLACHKKRFDQSFGYTGAKLALGPNCMIPYV